MGVQERETIAHEKGNQSPPAKIENVGRQSRLPRPGPIGKEGLCYTHWRKRLRHSRTKQCLCGSKTALASAKPNGRRTDQEGITLRPEEYATLKDLC